MKGKTMSADLRVGQVIRNLRKQRHMTGEELAKKVGLSQPGISKIETGVDPSPKPADVEAMLNILEAPQTIRQQILAALNHPAKRPVRRYKVGYQFERALEQERKSSLVRVFIMNIVPALLQTIEFREALLKRWNLAPGMSGRIMTITGKRQELLWSGRHRYHFILHEAALYTIPDSRAAQLRQLDRLELFINSRHVKIGILPMVGGLVPGPENGSFTLHDERHLAIALAANTVYSREPDDITEYLKIFNTLDKLADYGDAARALIHKAADYLS